MRLIFWNALGLVCFAAFLGFAGADETCTWKEDGTKVCDEDDTEHNVWKETSDWDWEDEEVEVKASQGKNDDDEDDDENENRNPVYSQNSNELEIELFGQFFNSLEEWDPSKDNFNKYSPEKIIAAMMDTLALFDTNDDGFLEYDEVEAVLLKKAKSQEVLERVKENFDEFEEGKMSIFQFLDCFKKLGNGEYAASLVIPFNRLSYLPAATAKKIMQGSIQMFLDSDINLDGKLDREEFEVGMKRSQAKRGDEQTAPPPEQLTAIFDIIDADKDDALTYTEFQGTIPEKPMTIDESLRDLFEKTDSNKDGLLSEDEYLDLMKARATKMQVDLPSDEEVLDGFHKLDLNEDGLLNPQEMKGVFDNLKTAQEKRITKAFNDFDLDGDGVLSMEELEIIPQGIEETSGQKVDLNVLMGMLDKNKDGVVSLEEMRIVLSQLMNMKIK
ncbi:putative calcium-binding protein CML44 [Orchesella cincta]|uniref:Putative calcium-binding protein CML44 n=1 Tax=Orchesella cincta TaxID=48709 RepID=A0A1D2NLE2_ORCCI|nr:putative calcium-binding protein CML44 [Orchesella cincta]